ncbi:MAG TPA: helix-hairpin-helix domain-containing protein, partial [Micromonosporaceae bacterium]
VKGDTDDLAAMSEVLRRRFARYLDAISESGQVGGPDDEDPPDPTATPGIEFARSRKFAYPPQLVVVDGGAPQVQVAAQVLADLGIDDIAVCGLAKRLEEVWLPGDEYPVILPRTSEALYLLQRVRDEAHRFAITFHRERRSKRMTTSLLDGVPGLGEVRRKALLTRFGSLKRLAAASVEEIASVPGIGERTASAIVEALASHSGAANRVTPSAANAAGAADSAGAPGGPDSAPGDAESAGDERAADDIANAGTAPAGPSPAARR